MESRVINTKTSFFITYILIGILKRVLLISPETLDESKQKQVSLLLFALLHCYCCIFYMNAMSQETLGVSKKDQRKW